MKSQACGWLLIICVLILCEMTPAFAQNRSGNSQNMSAKERAEARARAEAQDRANDIRTTRETGRTTVTIRPRESGTGNGEGSGSGYGAGGGPPWRRDGGGSDHGTSSSSGSGGRTSSGTLANSPNQSFLDEFGTPNKFTPQPGVFTQKILNNRGRLPISIRQKFGKYLIGNSVTFLGRTAKGHNYLKFSLIDKVNLSLEDMNDALKAFFPMFFPFGQAWGRNGRTVMLNNVFDITVLGVTNQVQVTEDNPYYFTLSTMSNHFFKGKATHGIFIDSDGQFWLFQEGTGDPSEWAIKQWFNNTAGDVMWDKLSHNFNSSMKSMNLGRGARFIRNAPNNYGKYEFGARRKNR